MAFTGNKDVDRTILLTLDDFDLCNVCKTSKYFNSLCSEEFWKLKIMKKFTSSLGDMNQIKKYMSKYKFQIWKLYYISLYDFLEKNYLGYIDPLSGREDFYKLWCFIMCRNEMLIQNIDNFFESWDLDLNSLKEFMDYQFNDNLLNPNYIFDHILSSQYKYIKNFSKYLLEYMLNSKNKRIYLEHSYACISNKLYSQEYSEIEKELLNMFLKHPRVDPNIFCDNVIMFGPFGKLIAEHYRLKPDNIARLLKNVIYNNTDPDNLIFLADTFLKKGGSLDELNEMVDRVIYYKNSFKIFKDYVKNLMLK